MSITKIIASFILPLFVLVVVPWLIHAYLETLIIRNLFSLILGSLLTLSGVFLIAWTNLLFVAFGEGTLAPWTPTQKLVLLGPYSYVRNPMILGVITTILGEAVIFSSIYLLGWAVVFTLINHIWFIIGEEPGLEKKYGKDYIRYKQSVPRWIPNSRPYEFG